MNSGELQVSRAGLIMDSQVVVGGIAVLPVVLNNGHLDLGAVLSYERPAARQGGGCAVGPGVVR